MWITVDAIYGAKLKFFPNPEGVECLNQAIYRDIQVLRTWEAVFAVSVDCIYGYLYSTPSALLENVLLLILRSLDYFRNELGNYFLSHQVRKNAV